MKRIKNPRKKLQKKPTKSQKQTQKRWWLFPLIILIVCASVAGYIITKHVQNRGQIAQPKCVGELETNFRCYSNRLKALVSERSVADAFVELKEEFEAKEYVQSTCHQLTHVIGQQATEKYGDVAEAYTYGDNFCWSGYYHGVMEGVIKDIGYDNIRKEVDSICDSLSEQGGTQYSFEHYNCVHGLGHGIMGVSSNELFVSLETCDQIKDWWERESCYGGVFMENVMAYQSEDTTTKYLNDSQPMYPCTDVKDVYKTQCYLMQTSHALEILGNDYARVFRECRDGVIREFQDTCYQSLGRDASGSTVSDVQKTKELCLLGPDEFAQLNCVIGAVKDFISYLHDDVRAREFCASFDSADIQLTCNTTSDEYYQSFKVRG